MIITLALLLLAACFPAVGEQAEELLTSGDYEYRVLEDGTAEITSYNSLMVVFPGLGKMRLDGILSWKASPSPIALSALGTVRFMGAKTSQASASPTALTI